MFALNNIHFTFAYNFDMKLCKGTENWARDQKIYNGWQQPVLPVLMSKRC